MFIGHYGAGLMIRRKFRDVPLWFLFLNLQLIDLVAFLLVFLGLEKAAYRSSDNPFFTNNLDLPYSHSLAGALILSALVYAILKLVKRDSWALIAALCVLSHWFIDLIVHTPDLSVFFGYIPVGLGLWNYPVVSLVLEIAVVLAGWLTLGNRNRISSLLLFLVIGSFVAMYFGKEPVPIQKNEALRVLMLLVPTALFIVLAYFMERQGSAASAVQVRVGRPEP